MAVITCDMPAGGTTGDVYLLHVRSQMDTQPDATATGFTLLDSGGASFRWDFLFTRDHDGTEDASTLIDGFDTSFVQAQCLLVRGADTFTVGAFGAWEGFISDVPTIDIPAVTTTVAHTLVLIGWTTWSWYNSSGAQVTAGTVDTRVVLDDHYSISIWSRDKATAGSTGLWTIDRGNESADLETKGGSWWTVEVAPVALDPVPAIVTYTTVAADADDSGGSTEAPPPRLITNPHDPTQTALIGGSTLVEQDALVATQFAAWDLAAETPDDLDFDAHVEDDIAANLAWLAVYTDWDPQTIRLTQQITRLMRTVAEL